MIEKWNFDEVAKKNFTALLNLYSPTSMEVETASLLREEWNQLNLDVSTDVMGNVCGKINKGSNFTLALVSHMDVVAVQITKIMNNGLLLFRRLGTQLYSLIGKRILIRSSNRTIEGVIGFEPLNRNVPENGLVDDDLWIDIGVSSQSEAADLVDIGDLGVYLPHFEKIGPNKICAAGLDDRVGVFIEMEVIKWCVKHEINISVCAIGTVQEEIGLRGAGIVGQNHKIDACIVLDVDFATDTLSSRDKMLGELHLGKGVGFNRKADNNPVLQSLVINVANELNIPYQVTLGRNIYGGTDAGVLQLQKGGIATTNINIPCRYMHSSNEMCDKRDIESAVNLLIGLISKLESMDEKNFIPGINNIKW